MIAATLAELPRPDTDPAPVARLDGVVYARLAPHYGGPEAEVPVRFLLRGDASSGCVAVLGGISASRDAQAWWADQVGPGRTLDPRRVAVLGIEFLGELPKGWSAIAAQDQAAALVAVLDVLGIESLRAAVGASYGGCVVLALGERYPERVERLAVISAAHRASPISSAIRCVQRELLALGARHGIEAEAVALARALAVTTYRSEAEFARRFDAPAQQIEGRWRLPVQDYLDAQGRRFARHFSPERYRLLSESLDLHRIDPAAVSVPLNLLAVREDRLVPLADLAELARAARAELAEIGSEYGHDAFLKESAQVSRWLHRVLAGQREGRMRRIERAA
jgi:homoserine O-acetyltransferase/O-succinyltransferase